MDGESETLIAHALRAEGFDASEDGTGRGTPLVPVIADTLDCAGNKHNRSQMVPIAFDTTQITSKTNRCQPRAGDKGNPLAAGAHAPAIAFHARQDPDSGEVTHALDTDAFSIGIQQDWAVRRITPTEAERLQGFPDGWTLVPHRGKPAKDGPRYKAIGNSMATPVMRAIGAGIEAVERRKREAA